MGQTRPNHVFVFTEMLLPDLLMRKILQFRVADRLLDFPSRGYALVPLIESEVGSTKV